MGEYVKTIVVADDSEAHRTLLKSMLDSERFDLVLKCDGLEVLNYLKEHTPDMLILDISMPHIDGLSITERVRWVPRLKDIPIVIVTAQEDKKTLESAEWVNANALIKKTELTKAKLMSTVTSLLNSP